MRALDPWIKLRGFPHKGEIPSRLRDSWQAVSLDASFETTTNCCRQAQSVVANASIRLKSFNAL